MNKYVFFTLFLLIFSSCTVTRQYYDFQHHGTESIKTNSDYKYVARNVMGKAKTTIKLSAWKKMSQSVVSDGMLADAKAKVKKYAASVPTAAVDQLRVKLDFKDSANGITLFLSASPK